MKQERSICNTLNGQQQFVTLYRRSQFRVLLTILALRMKSEQHQNKNFDVKIADTRCHTAEKYASVI